MSIRPITLLLFGQLLTIYAVCQTTAKSIDKTLTASYNLVKNSEYEIRYDSFAPAFKKTMIKHLSSPIMLNNRLDTLETLITIRQSHDKNIKFYSWDELTGGTWHEITSFVQFKGTKDKVRFEQLDTDKEMEVGGYTDSEIYQVHQIEEGSRVYYLTFGWGTHGNGGQHEIVYLFYIDGDRLVKSKSFNNGETHLAFEYSRSKKLNLDFDSVNRILYFDEFVQHDETLLYEKTGKRKALKFSKGVFR